MSTLRAESKLVMDLFVAVEYGNGEFAHFEEVYLLKFFAVVYPNFQYLPVQRFNELAKKYFDDAKKFSDDCLGTEHPEVVIPSEQCEVLRQLWHYIFEETKHTLVSLFRPYVEEAGLLPPQSALRGIISGLIAAFRRSDPA